MPLLGSDCPLFSLGMRSSPTDSPHFSRRQRLEPHLDEARATRRHSAWAVTGVTPDGITTVPRPCAIRSETTITMAGNTRGLHAIPHQLQKSLLDDGGLEGNLQIPFLVGSER